MPWQTLDDHLSLKPPHVSVPRKGNVTNNKTIYEPISGWTVWEDFTYENMRDTLGHYLELEDNFNAPDIQDSHRSITDEKGLDHLISSWHCVIVNNALKAIHSEDKQIRKQADQLPKKLHMTSGWSFWGAKPVEQGGGGTVLMHPDWAGGIVLDLKKRWNMIPGDTKLTHLVFQDAFGKPLVPDLKFRDADTSGRRSPTQTANDYKCECLGQVTAYAKHLGSRYTYIITNKQVIFVRITRNPKSPQIYRHKGVRPDDQPRGAQPPGPGLPFSSELKGPQTGFEYVAGLSPDEYTPSRNPANRPAPRQGATGALQQGEIAASSESSLLLPGLNPAGNARLFNERSSPSSANTGPSKRTNITQSPSASHRQHALQGIAGSSTSATGPARLSATTMGENTPSNNLLHPPVTPTRTRVNEPSSSHSTHHSSVSDDTQDDPTYDDGSQPDFDVESVEVAAIPWHTREGELTILHGLVWIHYLAGLETSIDDCYAPLGRESKPKSEEEQTAQAEGQSDQASDDESETDDEMIVDDESYD